MTITLALPVLSAVSSTKTLPAVSFKFSFIDVPQELSSIVYGYVFTKLHAPECNHTSVPLADLVGCGIKAEQFDVMDQWNCKLC
jgi:hypothetical protein